VWQAEVAHRALRGSGCPFCDGKRAARSNCLGTLRPDLAAQWNQQKNGNRTPFNVVACSGKLAWWKCRKGHEWQALISNRYYGSGCPSCDESKGEKAVAEALTCLGLLFIRQWKHDTCRHKKSLSFDFVVEVADGLKAIEYQGQQHFFAVGFGASKTKPDDMFEKVRKRDQIKREWCRRNNVALLEIPYWKIDSIDAIVKSFICGQ
jgi:hypothetical protein